VRIFLAGASGAIGRRLTPLLLAAGHTVTGTTRSLGKAEELKARGIEAVVVDVFDAAALRDAVLRARPDVVIHQLTDLPQTFDRERLAASLVNNARLRIDGTDNLVAASLAAGSPSDRAKHRFCLCRRPRAASRERSARIRRGRQSRGDQCPRGASAGKCRRQCARYGRHCAAVRAALRPWHVEHADARAPLHVDAAAHAALLAVTRGASGVYNIAEDDGAVTVEKARSELGFDPAFRLAS